MQTDTNTTQILCTSPLLEISHWKAITVSDRSWTVMPRYCCFCLVCIKMKNWRGLGLNWIEIFLRCYGWAAVKSTSRSAKRDPCISTAKVNLHRKKTYKRAGLKNALAYWAIQTGRPKKFLNLNKWKLSSWEVLKDHIRLNRDEITVSHLSSRNQPPFLKKRFSHLSAPFHSLRASRSKSTYDIVHII